MIAAQNVTTTETMLHMASIGVGGLTPPPFSFVNWEGGHRLEGCPAAIGCDLESIYEGGDHWIVIGRVVTLFRSEQTFAPLVFRAGHYATLEEREP